MLPSWTVTSWAILPGSDGVAGEKTAWLTGVRDADENLVTSLNTPAAHPLSAALFRNRRSRSAFDKSSRPSLSPGMLFMCLRRVGFDWAAA